MAFPVWRENKEPEGWHPSLETIDKSNTMWFRPLFSSYRCSDINSSQKMEGVLAKNQFVWSFVASLCPVWRTFLS